MYVDYVAYLIYATLDGVFGIHMDPGITSQAFPPITAVNHATTFDVDCDNKTLFLADDLKLFTVAFDDNRVLDPVTPINVSGMRFRCALDINSQALYFVSLLTYLLTYCNHQQSRCNVCGG